LSALAKGSKLSAAVAASLVVCAGWLAQSAIGATDFDRLLSTLTQRWGGGAVPKFNGWRALLESISVAQDAERLKRVNDFFNRQIQFADDAVVWGQADYWATLSETLGRGAGDCEDFAIAKYFTLREAGIDDDKLRLIYVRAKSGSAEGVPTQAHMVLAYYARADSEPLVLDNLIADIRPASRRPDLIPVFSFNAKGVFTGISARESTPAGSTGRLSRWEDLLRRARAEGFE
jgi:predicted transglutaminase-like cysteine proteinase